MKNEQNILFNKSFLTKKLHEYKSEIKDNSAIFLKWYKDSQKEEALQTNFLNDIFGKVLGYEIDTGEAEFNLLTEYKTQKDGTKVDGILGFITKNKRDIRVAIELKAKNTTNLDSVEKQAFEYRDKIDGIEWVITSNTNEIRLYSAGSGGRLKHQSWTLLELANSLEKQKEFHFLLSKNNLFTAEKSTSPTHKLLEDNAKEEELIEKRFYNDYKDLRKKLFNHLREQNPQKEPTTILSKTQKILDRIIFVCFCEDLNLLPDKIFTKLLKTTQEAFIEITIWQQIKGLFNAIDKGWPQKNINKFNGGLFAKDAELDELVLQDDILKEIIKISDWDFGSELTVNILGHIFEQSITDLEEIKADISGETHDKKQGKRKKDGVFYTPEYITRYIVEEAVGGWLHDRKTELGIDKMPELTEEDFVKKGKKPSKNVQKHIDFWNSYAKILKNIKVLDPACGSGAFLVAVFNFLENEWLTLSETLRKLGDDEQAGLFSYSQVYKHILKNNIYGVDLNPESVQITKLSLWLKTANKSEELTTLDANIKCGNSLIDDASIETGFYINNEGQRVNLAFNWQNEFSHVFENGGFDVVVGNPPYVPHDAILHRDYLKRYTVFEPFADLYCYFFDIANNYLSQNGYCSFITSNSFLRAGYGKPLRRLLLQNTLYNIVNLQNLQIFTSATVNTSILTFKKACDSTHKCLVLNNDTLTVNEIANLRDTLKKVGFVYEQSSFSEEAWILSNTDTLNLKKKVLQSHKTLEDIGAKIRLGIATGFNEAFIITNEQKKQLISQNSTSAEIIKPVLRGKDCDRYSYSKNDLFVFATKDGINVEQDYPAIYKHLDAFGKEFKERGAKGKHWSNLRPCSFFDDFKLDKIVWMELTDKPKFSRCSEEMYLLNSAYFLIPPQGFDVNYLLSILNSKLATFIIKNIANTSGVGTLRWINDYVKQIPIPQIPHTEQTPFITHAQKMLDLTRELNEKRNGFIDYFRGKFTLQKTTRNLEGWHTLEFTDFVKELSKQRVSLSATDEYDFKPLFDREKLVCVELQAQITKTDSEIDKMVYSLYGLSEEEIGVVENLTI